MLIRVRFGEEKEVLCNADCKVKHLLNHIKQTIHLPTESIIDLTDVKGIIV